MRRSFLVGIVPAVAFAAVSLTSTKQAFAGPHLDADLDFGTALQAATPRGGVGTAVDFSLGGGARLGYRFGLPGTIVYLQPEIGGSYTKFGFNSAAIGYDYAGVLKGGLKLGLTGVVQPNLFGHVGLGIMGYNQTTDCVNGVCQVGYLGPEADIGGGIDFRLAPGFTLGAQIAFNDVLVPEAGSTTARGVVYGDAKWVSFGLTLGFHIGEPAPRPVYVRPVYYRY
jgi:hypothetical protein